MYDLEFTTDLTDADFCGPIDTRSQKEKEDEICRERGWPITEEPESVEDWLEFNR